MPEVTVCMPFYNEASYISESIESVLKQSFEDFEFIVINDGSEDESSEIVRRYADKRIRYIECHHDFIQSLNTGLDMARGRYIARMDADDKLHEDRLLIQYNYLENQPEAIVCGAGLERFGSSREKYIPRLFDTDDVERGMTYCNCITAGMFRTEFINSNNIRYNSEFFYAEDYKLWADIIMAGGKLDTVYFN